MKTKKTLSERYEKNYSCVIIRLEGEEKTFIIKITIDQDNSYNQCRVWLFNNLENKWELFLNGNAIPNLKFNTTYIYKEEERLEDHKRIIGLVTNYLENLISEF